MNNLIVKNFVARIRLEATAQVFDVEGIPFEIMALTKALIDDVKSCVTYKEMLNLASNAGIIEGGTRLIDDPVISERLDELWDEDELDINSDPCVRYRVGEKVCEISGLESVLEEMLESEKNQKFVEDVKDKILTGVALTSEELETVKLHNLDVSNGTGVDLDRLNDDASTAVDNL